MATPGHYTEGKIVNGTNVGGGVFVPDPVTPTPPAPTEPTAGSVYKPFVAPTPNNTTSPNRTYVGQDGNTYDSVTGQVVAHGDINPVDEGAVRSRILNLFQNEINAQNQVYAEKLNEAKTAGVGRLGSARATQARSGLLGSDFAASQNDKVNTDNAAIEASINAEKAAKIAEIMGTANGQAASEIAAKRTAQQAGLDEYLKYLGNRTTEKQTNLQKLAGSLLDQKLSIPDLNPQQLKDLAASYGVTVDDITSAYNAEKRTRDAAQAKLDTEAAGTKFDQDLKTKQLALDTAYKNGSLSIDQYNAETARLNALTNQGKAGLDANGKPLPVASQIKNDALKSAKDLLTKFDAGTGTAAVGGSRIFGTQYIPGSAPKDFEIQFNNLKSLLSLDNVKLLKGQGAVSDAERALLASASTKLDLAQSEPEFRAALSDIITGLSGQGGSADTVTIQKPDGTTGTIPRANLDAAIKLGAKQI